MNTREAVYVLHFCRWLGYAENINKYRKFASYIGRLQEDKKQVVTVTTANMIYNKTNLLKTNTNKYFKVC